MDTLKLGWPTLSQGIISCPNCSRGGDYAVSVKTVWNPTTLQLTCACGQIILIVDYQERLRKDTFDREDFEIFEKVFSDVLDSRRLTEEEHDLWMMLRRKKKELSKAN